MKSAVQRAVVARLVGDAGVKKIVKATPGGPAVYAPDQPFADVFPRVTFGSLQTVPSRESKTDELFVDVDSWATGADATLVAGDLADANRAAIMAAQLVVPGFEVRGQTFEGDRRVGDPDETVEHIVSTFRFLVSPTA